ncbi:hypothetical protein AA650_14545 [Anabaena sp. WA102]|nr:hypothetical protein AA650_14545 [Anabaena sp. WA102]
MGAIAKRCCKQFAFWGMWRGDSEALLQAVRFLGIWEGDSEALLQAVRFLVWSAIAKRCCKQLAFWDVEVR